MINIEEKTQQILIETGLDFTIQKQPLFALNDQGDQIKSAYFGLINSKTNEVINTVKDSYTVSQNKNVVKLVLKGMEKFGEQLSIQKGGSINGGRRIYLQLAIEGESKVGDDVIKRYITVLDSNDGSAALSIGIGDLTMSCQNQFYRFYKAGDAKFQHTNSLTSKIQMIPLLIQRALDQSLTQVSIYNKFQSTNVSKQLVNDMVKHILEVDKTMDLKDISTRKENSMIELYSHINKEMNQKGENMWGLHSGITSWTTHSKSAPNRDNGRIESLLVGSNYHTNMKSFEFAMKQSKVNQLELV